MPAYGYTYSVLELLAIFAVVLIATFFFRDK